MPAACTFCQTSCSTASVLLPSLLQVSNPRPILVSLEWWRNPKKCVRGFCSALNGELIFRIILSKAEGLPKSPPYTQKLRAVRHACLHFLFMIQGQSESRTSMYYTDKGEQDSLSLSTEAVKLQNWRIAHNILIWAVCLPTGTLKVAVSAGAWLSGN